MIDPVQVQCPWCFEHQWLWCAYDDVGEMIQDCEVCCRPWTVRVWRDEAGGLHADVERA